MFCFYLFISNASANVVLWGERATTFPGEQVHKDGQTTLQIVIFVGALVRNYIGMPPILQYMHYQYHYEPVFLCFRGHKCIRQLIMQMVHKP